MRVPKIVSKDLVLPVLPAFRMLIAAWAVDNIVMEGSWADNVTLDQPQGSCSSNPQFLQLAETIFIVARDHRPADVTMCSLYIFRYCDTIKSHTASSELWNIGGVSVSEEKNVSAISRSRSAPERDDGIDIGAEHGNTTEK